MLPRAWLGDQLEDLDARVVTEPFAVRAVADIYAAPEATWQDATGQRRLVFGQQVMPHLASACR